MRVRRALRNSASSRRGSSAMRPSMWPAAVARVGLAVPGKTGRPRSGRGHPRSVRQRNATGRTTTMKATQISAYGDPGVLRVTEVPRPEPGTGQLLVAVGATSVNGHDALVRSGGMKIVSGRRFPIGLGLDFAGTVAALGPGVTGVPVGQPVWGTVHPRQKHTIAGAA